MSSGADNNLALAPGNWRRGGDNGAPNYRDENGYSALPRPLLHHLPEWMGMGRARQEHDPWGLFEERVRSGPYGLTRFPSQPHSPIRILVLDDGMEQRVSPRLVQFVRDSPVRVRSQWNMGSSQQGEEAGLSREEFKRAMSKMRNQIFNPTYPRKSAWKRGLFSRYKSKVKEEAEEEGSEEDGEEGKECTICLEAFEGNEKVLITPCNHMFHNDCLVPWVKSHGHCPVCRFAFYQRRRENGVLNSINNNIPRNGVNGTVGPDLIALIRAMEEALDWVNLPHARRRND